MLISVAQGRLGNQLFEYAYLQSIRKPHEALWLLGFDDLYSVFDIKSFNFKTKGKSKNQAWFVRKLWRLFIKLRSTKLISFIKEDRDGHKGDLLTQKGKLPFNFVEGYFQWDNAITEDFFSGFTFKKNTIASGDEIYNSFPKNKQICFIHVRHGDYDADMRLPDSFYIDAVKKFDLEKTFFYIAGDDPSWAENAFSFVPDKIISRNSMALDLYIMTKCKGGIISNSTFAYWGAAMAIHNSPSEKLTIYAPEYWTGWKLKEWRPSPKIMTDMFTFIPVENH